jgi:hypothetical protein
MKRLLKSPAFRWTGTITLILLLAYVGSYAVLSRRGMAQSKAAGCKGFYFFPPENTASWKVCNYGCVTFYYPLIAIEMWFGTVDGIGSEPMWGLSGADGSERHEAALAERRGMIIR